MDSEFELCVLSLTVGHADSSVTMSLLERISVSDINMVWSSVSTGTQALSATEDEETQVAQNAKRKAIQNAHGDKSFQNTFRASEGRLYLLGRRQLQVARVQTLTQKVYFADLIWLRVARLGPTICVPRVN